MFTEITKTVEANQQLAKELAAQVATATTDYAQALSKANARLAETATEQFQSNLKAFNEFAKPALSAFGLGK
jgi:hypothetical protein